MEGPSPDKFAFAQWSEAIKSPVGTLSDGTVLRSKMEGPRPDKFAFAQRSNESPSGAFKRQNGLAQQDGGVSPRQVHVDMARFLWWSINNYDSWQGA